ncbi:MAG: DUF5320 domain-containing protein [Bacteroidales bacterium]|nr:DUF5320 domain-containing protein [Bacteroidales bacterium]
MPNYDRTGPTGSGPMTGRQMGRCNPANKGLTRDELPEGNFPNEDQPVRGIGLGRGFARRCGFGKGRGLARGNRFGNRNW